MPWLSIAAQNDTDLLGEPFNISPGAVDGRMVVSVLRLSQEWIDRGQNHVLALRSTFNFGLDVLDATDNGMPGDPNGKFFSWLGQAQYVHRLFNTQNQFILRVTGQWTDDQLLALEQISVGGAETVRGYRENQLVRDRGYRLVRSSFVCRCCSTKREPASCISRRFSISAEAGTRRFAEPDHDLQHRRGLADLRPTSTSTPNSTGATGCVTFTAPVTRTRRTSACTSG